MNKKITTYILLGAFIAIWIIVGFSIYKYLHKKESINNFSNSNFKENNAIDTFSLLLNYSDPFTGKINFAANEIKEKAIQLPTKISPPKEQIVKPKDIVQSKPIVQASNVQFEGIIDNTTAKKKIALVKINKVEYLLKEGETQEDIKIISISNDFIMISRNGAKSEKILK